MSGAPQPTVDLEPTPVAEWTLELIDTSRESGLLEIHQAIDRLLARACASFGLPASLLEAP